MKHKYLIPAILLTGLLSAGCMQRNCDCDPDISQPVVFQFEYINYAWGYRHFGFLIDKEGKLNGFSKPEKWFHPDSVASLSEEELEFNLMQCDTLCGTVNRSELNSWYGKIGGFLDGQIIESLPHMADAGTGVLSAWYPVGTTGRYRRVLLASNGDYSTLNTAEGVKELLEWLKKAGKTSNRFIWYDE